MDCHIVGKASAKSKLWRAFAEYIKLRDSEAGYANCISCGKEVEYPNSEGNLHAGHYYSRSVIFNTLYFCEKNVQSQCHYCNTYLEGNSPGFAKGLIAKYGEGIVEELEKKKAAGMLQKLYDHDYDEMAKEYREKVREIKKKRGIR